MRKVEIRKESFREIWPEARDLLEQHYKEIGLYNSKVVFDPDVERYESLCDAGALYIVAVRVEGTLVGYCANFITQSLHYKATKSCINDVFYIHPDYRKGFLGVRLIKEMESLMKEEGVNVLMFNFKTYAPLDSLFSRLGWDFSEKVYTKYLGD